jgi:CubicO group peptidase (beta-lactamase class C family)
LLEDGLRSTGVVGASLGILSNGGSEVAHAGLADRERSRPVEDDTRFQIASLTKPMVATVVAMLAEGDQLRLDDPMADHVPELQPSAWGQEVTILDLLANRGGVPMTAAVEFEFDAEGDDCLGRLAAAVATQPLAYAPRRSWSYNNTGWCLLGRALETVCGTTWEEAMRRELFAPLGMRHTAFIAETPATAVARCYSDVDGELTVVPPWTHRALGPAGATVCSTVADLLRFARLHLEDDRLAELRTVEHRRELPDFMDAWCRGWACWDWPGGPVWGWCGIAEGHRAILQLIPRRGAVALITNSASGRELYRDVFPPILAERFGVTMPPFARAPASGGSADLARYAGVYGWPDYEFAVHPQRDRLRVIAPELEEEARPVTERVFALTSGDPDVPVIVFDDFATDGRPQVLYLAVWAYRRLADSKTLR